MTNTLTRTQNSQKIKLLTLSGVFAALIYILTAYVHVPTGVGYTHAGDGLIFLAASLLPAPYAMAAGAIGGALADGLSGFLIWLPATVVIKAATALFFSNKSDKIITKRNLIALLPSLALCVVGYSLYQGTVITLLQDKESISASAMAVAFAQTPAYCIQIAASSVLYVFLGISLDRMKFKSRFLPKE